MPNSLKNKKFPDILFKKPGRKSRAFSCLYLTMDYMLIIF